jgi:hypothetical protein
MEDKSVEKSQAEGLTWQKPQVRRLEIVVDTREAPKDTSFEDGFVKGAGWPKRK